MASMKYPGDARKKNFQIDEAFPFGILGTRGCLYKGLYLYRLLLYVIFLSFQLLLFPLYWLLRRSGSFTFFSPANLSHACIFVTFVCCFFCLCVRVCLFTESC